MDFGVEHLSKVLTYFLAMLLSLTVHEAAHALVAYWRGDRTAQQAGRLTLNPLAHADPLGTFILPLVGALTQLPVIGWAKPVPVDLRNVKNPKWDNVLIAAAGPLSNLFLCTLMVLSLVLFERYGAGLIGEGSFFYPLVQLANAMIWVNVFLALFNLIPLPPLDGATVFGGLLPWRWARKYEELVAPYGTFILFALIVAGGLHWLPGVASAVVGFVARAVGSFV